MLILIIDPLFVLKIRNELLNMLILAFSIQNNAFDQPQILRKFQNFLLLLFSLEVFFDFPILIILQGLRIIMILILLHSFSIFGDLTNLRQIWIFSFNYRSFLNLIVARSPQSYVFIYNLIVFQSNPFLQVQQRRRPWGLIQLILRGMNSWNLKDLS